MWTVNQRVVSPLEPELGLGVIEAVSKEKGVLHVRYPLIDEVRQYGMSQPSIKRFLLSVGKKVGLRSGQSFVVQSIQEQDGLLFYQGEIQGAWEYELEDKFFSEHEQIFDQFVQHLGGHKGFDLRLDGLKLLAEKEQTLAKGLMGPKLHPLPHQLYIAAEVARRARPRVLLADEVGLGKTIEAGLIFSVMKSLHRAQKVLILTPDALKHQWVFEMRNLFAENFSLFDEERWYEEEKDSELSPLASEQQIIIPTDLLLSQPNRLEEALAIEWDLLIVDEAHRLEWDEEHPSPAWKALQKLSQKTRGLLLLTATPRQKGLVTQFGLLHLLDPQRFNDFDEFLVEQEDMELVAKMAREIQSGQASPLAFKKLQEVFAGDPVLSPLVQTPATISQHKAEILSALVDRHGTGRILFRNRRSQIGGFPKRKLFSYPLPKSKGFATFLKSTSPEKLEGLSLMDVATGRNHARTFCELSEENPRFKWTKDFFSAHASEKILVLSTFKEQVLLLNEYLLKHSSLKQKNIAMFHEGMSVLEMDQQAASFASPKGPQVLLASELGSEGRNFQFVKHLVFLDLPRHPDVAEQRMGRLDRIGQKNTIHIHIPWCQESPEEVLFRWYHEGINLFDAPWFGMGEVLEVLHEELLQEIRIQFRGKELHALSKFLTHTQEVSKGLREAQNKSVDVLLDINSYSKEKGEALIDAVDHWDDHTGVERFVRSILDYYAMDYEDFDNRGSLVIHPDSLSFLKDFFLQDSHEDVLLTFDRKVALERQNALFVTVDHSLIESMVLQFQSKGTGTASLCLWQNNPLGQGVFLELILCSQVVAPKKLEIGRFFPREVFHFVYDIEGKDRTKELPENFHEDLSPLSTPKQKLEGFLKEYRDKLSQIASKVLEKVYADTEVKLKGAIDEASQLLKKELERLQYLKKINPTVQESDILQVQEQLQFIQESSNKISVQIEAIRLIISR